MSIIAVWGRSDRVTLFIKSSVFKNRYWRIRVKWRAIGSIPANLHLQVNFQFSFLILFIDWFRIFWVAHRNWSLFIFSFSFFSFFIAHWYTGYVNFKLKKKKWFEKFEKKIPNRNWKIMLKKRSMWFERKVKLFFCF